MRPLSLLILTVTFYPTAAQIFGINLKPKQECFNALIEEFKNTTEAALLPLMKTVVDQHPPLEKDVQEDIFTLPFFVAKEAVQMGKDILGLLANVAQQLRSMGDSELADQITQIGKQIFVSVNKLPPAIAQCLKA